MTEVIGKIVQTHNAKLLFVTALVLTVTSPLLGVLAQSTSPAPVKPAEKLYLKLSSVELDAGRVYDIREATLDYPKLHISLDDGKIGFTADVYGRVTGAFFEGDGELLVVPPDQAERASMMLFTGAAILEQRFQTAYFRFNDDTYSALQSYLRPNSEAKDFVAEWGDTARNLAANDALRLFMTFSHCLPEGAASETAQCPVSPKDRFFHARIQSAALGVFDASYDSSSSEEISVGQAKTREQLAFYNVWAQFPAHAAQKQQALSDDIAIHGYKIATRITPPSNLQAKTQVQIEVLHGGARAVPFELSRYLKLSRVSEHGQPLEFIQNQAVEGTQLARRGNDVIAVVFPASLRTGENIDLEFAYGGDVLSEAGGGLLYVGARGIWYPNRGMAAANFDLRFDYPAVWTLLATGTLVSGTEGRESSAPGEKSSRWITQVPIPVAGFNLGKYSRTEARAKDAVVEAYAAAGVEHGFPKPPEEAIAVPPPRPGLPSRDSVPLVSPPLSPSRNAQIVADAAARAIDFYASRFGPYAYGTLRLTQMPGPLSQGWPGLIFLSSYSFLTPEDRAHIVPDPVDAALSQQVTAHETAHEWWGDLVYWRGYRDQWLFEGLANYCSLMMLEQQNPLAFARVMTRYRSNLLAKNKAGAVLKDAGPVTLGLRLSSSEFPDGYEAISYGRGTWLFHMLRHMLDDVPFDAPARKSGGATDLFAHALRRLRDDYAGKPVTTREVLKEFENELPAEVRYEGRKRLDWFYEGWVNGTAVPHLQLQSVKFSDSGSSTIASGAIVQKDAPKELVTSVPIFAQLPGNRRVLAARIFADGPETAFRIPVPPGTRKLLIDPDETVLRN